MIGIVHLGRAIFGAAVKLAKEKAASVDQAAERLAVRIEPKVEVPKVEIKKEEAPVQQV